MDEDKLWTGDRGKPEAGQFGRVFDHDELLHPHARVPGDTLTETWAYMWYIPEERISSQIHIWVHPNLGIVTPAIGVWRGHKSSMISAEIMDVRAYVSAASLGDGSDMLFPQNLRVQLIEPYRKMRITYEDAERGNALDLTVTDFSPPVMRGSENHFDQATWNRGTVTLRGKTYTIDGIGMRDRSWGELRTEASVKAPPFTWMTGSFIDRKVSWNVAAFDDPDRDPDWKGLFTVDRGHLLHDGWIWRDGKLSRLFNASKITRRDPVTRRPLTHEIDFQDADGRAYHFTGDIIASVPWTGWPNMQAWICATRWRWEDAEGHGDTQEVQWGDFHHLLRTDQDLPPGRR